MKKYEYGQLNNDRGSWFSRWSFEHSGAVSKTYEATHYFLQVLDELGKEGWELIMYDRAEDVYIFKREIS